MVANFNKKANKEFFTGKLLFRAIGVLFLAIIGVLIFTDFKIYQKKQELVAQINDYQKQIEDIKNNNQNLKTEIANSDNTDYLEKIAYEQLGQQKPGEKEVIFVMPQKKSPPAVKSENFWSAKNWPAWLGGAWQWLKSKI